MDNNVYKYSLGDIIKLNEDNNFKRIIIAIFNEFYDETGYSKEIYYNTKCINDDTYPPCPINEFSIDKYYTKFIIK